MDLSLAQSFASGEAATAWCRELSLELVSEGCQSLTSWMLAPWSSRAKGDEPILW
jgi:hypothetical protein